MVKTLLVPDVAMIGDVSCGHDPHVGNWSGLVAQIIEGGPESFNPFIKQSREEFPNQKLDLRALILPTRHEDVKFIGIEHRRTVRTSTDPVFYDFKGLDLRNTKLQGVDLSPVANLDHAQLRGAEYDHHTQFPAGFTEEDAKRLGMQKGKGPYVPIRSKTKIQRINATRALPLAARIRTILRDKLEEGIIEDWSEEQIRNVSQYIAKKSDDVRNKLQNHPEQEKSIKNEYFTEVFDILLRELRDEMDDTARYNMKADEPSVKTMIEAHGHVMFDIVVDILNETLSAQETQPMRSAARRA